MSEILDQDEVDRMMGAVLRESRLNCSKILRRYTLFEILERRANLLTQGMDENCRHLRLYALPDNLRGFIYDALLNTIMFHRFFYYFLYAIKNSESTADLKNQSILAAHLFADNVALELFNFFKILQAPELTTILGSAPDKLKSSVLEFFPKLIDARHAVSHAHDRNLGRKNNTQISEDPGYCRVFANGKTYMDDKGHDFNFEFSEEKFICLLEKFQEVVEIKCA